ncbi:MAG: ABC transporter substrate-binding protein [Candidatus Dormibacteraeota bacterium]|nr:ABC transporter substrate-binding protein [Candidatus Dormibacteraeota bacterium]
MRSRPLGLLMLAGLLIAACGGGTSTSNQQSGPKHGGTLTVAVGIDPDTLDPAAQTTTTVQQMVLMITEPLLAYDEKNTLKPVLAEKWDAAADGLSYSFTLRQGVKFSDGEPFNAAAVKFSLDRMLSPATFKTQPGVLRVIKSTDVVDDSHVKITLKTPFPPFLGAMTQAAAAVIAPNSVSQAPNTPALIQKPVGTGPYVFKERVNGDHVTFDKNPSYWGSKPNYDTQVYKVVPDAATREALVKAGQAEVSYLPPANDLPALQQSQDLKVILGPSDRTIFMSINTPGKFQPLLQKPAVREALNYAVNKDAIVKNALFGAATPLDAPMSKALFGYCSTGKYDYNPDKAKQMLKDAGAEGMKLKVISPQGRYIGDYQVAQAVAGDLRKVGLQVELANPSDWPTYLSRMVNVPPDQATADMHLLGWAPSFLDAAQQFQIMTPDNFPPKGLNTSYYSNQSVTDLVTKANGETDSNQRKLDYCSAGKQVWKDAPWIFLYNQKNPIVTTSKVKGIYGLANEQFVTSWASPA